MSEQTFSQVLNDLTKRRVGRPLKIETPEQFAEEAEQYFQWVDDNPYLDEDFIGKDATAVIRKRRRPYLLTELALWLGFSRGEDLNNYGERKDFSELFYMYKSRIQSAQLNGAVSNHFNANLIARLHGLSDNVNNNTNVSHAVAPEMLTELASILRNKGQDPTEG